jgi:hypothetical protein
MPSSTFAATTIAALLPFSALAQSQTSAPAVPVASPHFTYEIVLDTGKPVAGKQVQNILALDLDDSGDVAVLAECTGGTGIWVKSKAAWVVFTGDPSVAGAQPIEHLGAPSLGPDGSVRYRADYLSPKGGRRNGYFQDKTLLYENSWGLGPGSDGYFTPDKRIIITGNSPMPVIGDAQHMTGPPPLLIPSDTGITNGGADHPYLAINRTTGHYLLVGVAAGTNGRASFNLYLNQALRASNLPEQFFQHPAMFINAHDDIAFGISGNVNSPIVINNAPVAAKGWLHGFNDGKDLLYRTGVDHDSRYYLNGDLVIERGNYVRMDSEKIRLGIPQTGPKAFVYDIRYPTLNNKRQVAFAMMSIPVGAVISTLHTIKINDVPVPFQVVVATRKP